MSDTKNGMSAIIEKCSNALGAVAGICMALLFDRAALFWNVVEHSVNEKEES